jgi:hypothetical protein
VAIASGKQQGRGVAAEGEQARVPQRHETGVADQHVERERRIAHSRIWLAILM